MGFVLVIIGISIKTPISILVASDTQSPVIRIQVVLRLLNRDSWQSSISLGHFLHHSATVWCMTFAL